MVASLAAALSIGMVAGAYADEVVDGFSYEGIGVGATIYNADVEFGEITMSIESPEGGTLTMELDTAVLAPASDDGVVVMLDGFLAEPTIDVSDSTMTITLEVPAGTTEVILSGIADAAEVAASAAQAPDDEAAADEPAAEAATEPAADEPAAEAATEPEDEAATEPAADEPAAAPAASAPAIQPTGEVAEFVEPGVDVAVYVDRYLNDAEFAAWYDQWYPGQAFYSAVGITQAEYQSIVDSIRGPIQCPEDTEMVDGVCVRYQMSCGPGTEMVDGVCVLAEVSEEPQAPAAQPASEKTSATALEVYEAQGEGLQIGVAAVGGFGIAIAILLLLFLPHRIRRWHRARRQTAEA